MTTPLADHSRRTAARVALLAVAVVAASVAYKYVVGQTGAGEYLRLGYSDIPPLFHTERLVDGAVPYLDHPVEYPVLTGLWMWLAALPAADDRAFLVWTGVLLAATGAVTAWLLTREVGWRRALVVAAAPTLLVSAAVNWDLPSVALATAGIVAHRHGRDGWAGVWLGLGTAAKLWPGLLLLALVPAAWALRGCRAGLATGGAAVGVWVTLNLPILAAAPDGWLEFLRLNRERPVDWDPLWVVAGHLTGWAPSVGWVNLASAVLFVVGAVAVLAVTVRRALPTTWHHAALPILAVFLLTNKVYSPQFSLWLLPLLAVTFPGWVWVLAFGVADVAVSVTRFPYLANLVEGVDGAWPWWPFGTAVVVRAAVLAAAAVIGWRRATAGGTDTRRYHSDSQAEV